MAREETIQVSLVKSSLYNTTIASLRSEAKELQAAFGSIQIGNTAKALKEQATASKAAAQAAINEAKANKEAANAEKARYQAVKELENATKAHLQAQKEAQNLATAKIKTEKEAANAMAATARAEKAKVQALAAADKAANGATRSMQAYASAMMNTIKQIVGFAGATQSIRYALNEMKAMSDEMVTYRKVTGATAQEMEKIRAASYSTAKKYGQTPSDFLAAASEMARAGYGQNSAAMAELATKTQLVGDMTAEAASKFLLAVDAGYKFQGNIESLTSVLDAANEVDNNFATSIEKISEGMTLVASLAGSVHVPVEQLIAALGTMTATTQRSGGEMARGLRSIMLNVLGDTTTEIEEGVTVTEENIQSLTDALEKYGDSSIAAARKAGKLINPMQAIASLAKAWKSGKLDESTLFGISKDIAGQRYYNAFSSLIQNYEMYEAMLEKIAGSAGSAQKEVDNMLDSWTVKANQAKTAWVELVNNTISENFIKGLLDGGIAALEFTGNLENLALMAGGAYEAIKSLSTGISNLRNNKGFGGFNAGMTALGLGVAAIGAWKASYEKAIKDAQQSAAKQVAEALNDTTYKTVAEIEQKYIATEKGDIETLKTLQDALNKAVGEQGTAIDMVNGKYEEQITKLQNLTREQRELAAETLRTAMSAAVSAFNQSDLNGFWRSGNSTGVNLPDISAISGYLSNSQYLQFSEDAYYGNKQLWLRSKPTDAEGILAFYKEVEDFYTFLGSHTATGEKASQGMKTIGEQYSTMYTALGKFVSTVRDAADPVKAAQEGLDALKKSLDELGGKGNDSTEAAEKGIDGVTKSVNSLTDALNGATKAKEDFDTAMKTSKADAFNDYAEAFKTLQDEINAGRVNSTAYYAAAKMLLGDEAYAKTGGTSQGVMNALNRRGISGSAMEAYDILSGVYKDEAGNVIEGYGAWELLNRTKGYTGTLTDINGNNVVPTITDADIAKISDEWGGLSADFVKGFFAAALNALDQYDVGGEETMQEAKTAAQENAQSTRKTAEGMEMVAEADGKVTQAAEAAAESLEKVAESTENPEGTENTGADLSPAEEQAKTLKQTIEEIQGMIAEINSQTIGGTPNPAIMELLENLALMESDYDINISPTQNTKMAASVVGALSKSLQDIEKTKSIPGVNVSLAEKTQENIKEQIISIIQGTKDDETLNAIELELKGNSEQLDSDIQAAISAQRESIKLNVKTEGLGEANKAITLAAKDRDSSIEVSANTDPATKKVETAVNKINKMVAQITVEAAVEPKPGTSGHNTGGETNGSTSSGANGGSGGNSTSYGSFGISGGYGLDPLQSILGADGATARPRALGTNYHPGGLALVNDGSGPELIIDQGRAFVAGGGRPTMLNLSKGAKVFTASETRAIFGGSGIPAYSAGTGILKDHPELRDWSQIFGLPSAKKDNGDSSKDKNAEGTKNDSDKSSNNEKQIDEKAFASLKEMIDYIIGRIGEGLDEQLDILDKQIAELKLQRDAAKQQNELEEKQKAVAEAQKDLETALSERTVRYLGEDGKWHWMADARNVQSAQEALQKAQEDLAEYQDEAAFNAQVEALEKQKEALQAEYDRYSKAWEKIQSGVNTPTGTVEDLLAAVFAGGTPQQQTGANAVRDYLIGTLLQGGSYKGNYGEALDAIAQATAGTPIMPNGSNASLAALIATGGGLTGSVADALKGGTAGTIAGMTGTAGQGGTSINYNYFVNGMEIGSDAANNMTLSEVMRGLTVYAGQ